ncbi:MAG: DNA repair exonuclease [Clostridia bacterium]|nr:DNA repair exonuclease [Clostridia bacterium]
MENNIRFLHTADLHLGAELSNLKEQSAERNAEMLLCLERIFALAKNEGASLLLIAGDLFENNSVPKAIFNTFLNCVETNSNITVVFAAGNHDPLTADSPFLTHTLPQNLLVLDTQDCILEPENLPVRIYGKSFKSIYEQGSNSFSLPVIKDEKINIMVLHAELGSVTNGNYNPITRNFLETSGMDYIALGHIHAFSGVEKIGSTHFCYSGTPEPHGFDEGGIKGVVLGEFTGKTLKTKFIETAERSFNTVNVDISDKQNSAEAAEQILAVLRERYGQSFGKNFYKIILDGFVGENANFNNTEILKRISPFVYYAKIRNNTKIKVDLNVLKNENSLKGIFVKTMLKKIESETDSFNKEKLEKALYLGLSAFNAEVNLVEN